MNILPCYTHIISPKLKNIYLGFDEHGELVIKSPKVPITTIEKLIISKASWINKTQNRLKNKKGKIDHLSDKKTIYYLGEPFELEIFNTNTKPKLHFTQNKCFNIYGKNIDSHMCEKLIDKFYLNESKIYITPKVEQWAKIMNLYPLVIKYRKTKRQWGSCSYQNSLSFNTMLMKLPQDVIEYVIIHELAHIKHKNHQKAFWELVAQHSPNHKQLRKQLKEYI